MMTDICCTRLISDAPAPKDSFGSHDRIAASLAELVSAEPGGKAIGLEGGWGSGKSTIVNLLRAKSRDNPDLLMHVVDAWAHEGDPLRRTFLETLIDKLIAAQWVPEREWADKKEILCKRKKTSETKTRPRFTRFAGLLVASTFLVPIGAALLNNAFRSPLYLPGPDKTFAWQLWLGLLLTLTPVLLLLPAWIFGKDADTWAILVKGSTTVTSTEAVESPEPSSVEFQSIFLDLMMAALGRKRERRFVLVLDNLDRIAPQHALSVWSALRTFLQVTDIQCSPWLTRFWILVPYDPQGVGRAWSNDVDAADFTKAFLEKSFQLRLSVPALLLSNWRVFLDDLLHEALPKHDPEDFHSVYRLFALEGRLPPTPRSLKLYVNEIGGLHRQWQDEFPLSDLAYYVLLRGKGAEIEKRLLDGTLPDPQVQDLVSPDVRDNLAALAFNTSVGQARQLLLRDALAKTLEQGDAEGMGTLARLPGFWEVLESIEFGQWSEREPSKLANAAMCLADSGTLRNTRSAMTIRTLRALRAAALNVEIWRPLGCPLGKGLGALCHVCGDEHLAQDLLRKLSHTQAEGDPSAHAEAWCLTVSEFVKALKENDLYPGSSDGISLPEPAPTTLLTCYYLSRMQDDSLWKDLRINVTAAELQDSIVERLRDDTTVATVVDGCAVLDAMPILLDWSIPVATARSRLETSIPTPSGVIQSMLDFLSSRASKTDDAANAIVGLARGGYLLHHLHGAYARQRNPELGVVARCLVLHLMVDPMIAAPPQLGNAPAGRDLAMRLLATPGPDLIRAITGYLSETGQVLLLYGMCGANPGLEPLVVGCLREAMESDRLVEFFPPGPVVEHWRVLSSLVTDGGEHRLAAALVEKTELVSYLGSIDFIPDLGDLYTIAVRNGVSQTLVEVCVRGLKGIEEERWRKELQEEENLAELVVALVESGVEFELGHRYKDAVVEHARQTAAGEAQPSHLDPEEWRALFAVMDEDTRNVLRSDLLEMAVTRGGDIAPEFFRYYGSELAKSELVEDRRTVSGLFTTILRDGNREGLRWMLQYLRTNPGQVELFNRSAVRDFRKRLRDMLGDEQTRQDEDLRALQAELATLFRVRAGTEKAEQRPSE
jgi:hypothetical protein